MFPELAGTREVTEAAAKEVAGLAQPILGSSVGELSQLIADRVRFWRWRSAVRIMKQANEIREKEGLVGRKVPLKFFLPFIEEASKESENENEVSELWTRLLATADKSTTGFDLVCLDVLRSIGGAEAVLLRQIEAAAPLFECVRDGLGRPVGTVFELRLKEILTEEELARLGQWDQFRDGLARILEEQLGIPTIRLFGSMTKYAEQKSFSILTLEKLGLIEGSTYWRRAGVRPDSRIGFVDLEFYKRICIQRCGKLNIERENFVYEIGEMLTLSSFGEQFVRRCVTGSRAQR